MTLNIEPIVSKQRERIIPMIMQLRRKNAGDPHNPNDVESFVKLVRLYLALLKTSSK